MANNKKIDVTFQAQGIKEIEKELRELQDIAKKVTLTEDLNEQFQGLVDQADEVKDALNALKDAFAESAQQRGAKKNKQMTDMEKKIKDMKTAISNLTQQLGKANLKVDASMAKLDTAITKLNDPKNFEGVLKQIQNVQNGFNELIKLTNDYRQSLSQTAEVGPRSISKGTGNLKELKALLNIGREGNIDDKTREMNDKQLRDLLSKFEKRVKELYDAAPGAKTKGEQVSIQTELLKIFTKIKDFTEDLDEHEKPTAFSKKIEQMLNEFPSLFRGLYGDKKKEASGRYVNTDADIKILTNVLNKYVKELQSQQEPIPKKQQTEIMGVIDGLMAAVTKKGKKTQVELRLAVAPGEEKKLKTELNTIIEHINATNPPVEIKVNFVSDVKQAIRGRSKLIDKFKEELEKLPEDSTITPQLKKLMTRIDKNLAGDLQLIITSNIEDLAEENQRALNVIKKEITDTPMALHIKVDPEDIQKQLNSMGTLTLPIGNVEIKKNIIDKVKVEDEAKKIAEAFKPTSWAKVRTDLLEMARAGELTAKSFQNYEHFNEIMESIGATADVSIKSIRKVVDGINTMAKTDDPDVIKGWSKNFQTIGKQFEALQQKKKEALTSEIVTPGDALTEHIVKFIQEINKIPDILKGASLSLSSVNWQIEDPSKLHDAVQTALDKLDDLHIRISRIDMYQPTIDRLKLDVKSDTLKLIDVEKSMVTELRLLANNLVGATTLTDANGNQKPIIPQTNFAKVVKALDDLSKLITLIVDKYGLLEKVGGEGQDAATSFNNLVPAVQLTTGSLIEMVSAINKVNLELASLSVSAPEKQKPAEKEEKPKEEEKPKVDLKELYKSGKTPSATLRSDKGMHNDSQNIKSEEKQFGQQISNSINQIIPEYIRDIPNNISKIQKSTENINAILRDSLGETAINSDISHNVIDAVRGENIMKQVPVINHGDGNDRNIDQIEIDLLLSGQHGIEPTFSKEKFWIGNTITGEASPISVTGLQAQIPLEMWEEVFKQYGYINPDLAAHHHTGKYIVPSGDDGDFNVFNSALQMGIDKHLITSGNQVALFDMSVLKNYMDFWEAFSDNFSTYNLDLDDLQKVGLTKISELKRYSTKDSPAYDSWKQSIIDAFVEQYKKKYQGTFDSSFEKELRNRLNGVIENDFSNLDVGDVSQRSQFLSQLAGTVFQNSDKAQQGKLKQAINKAYGLDLFNFGNYYTQLMNDGVNIDEYDLGMQKAMKKIWDVLKASYKKDTGEDIPEFEQWAKILDVPDGRKLSDSEVRHLLGMSETTDGTLKGQVENINQNVSSIASNIEAFLKASSNGTVDSTNTTSQSVLRASKGSRISYNALLEEFQKSPYKYLNRFADKKGLTEAQYAKLEQRAIDKGITFSTDKAKETGNEIAKEVAKGIEEKKTEVSEAVEEVVSGSWYGGYAKDMAERSVNYSALYDEDLGRFQSAVGKMDRSDLQYMTQFFDEYEDYIRRTTEEASKADKGAWKDYGKFIKDMRQNVLGGLKAIEEEQDLDAYIKAEAQADEYDAQEKYYETEKARIQQAEQEKQDLEALIYANQQADEYAATERYYQTEKARIKQEEQDRQDLEASLYAQSQADEYAAQEKYYEAERKRLEQKEQDERDLEALIYANQQASEYEAQERYYETEKARIKQAEQDRQDLEASILADEQAREYDAIEKYYNETREQFKKEGEAQRKAETEAQQQRQKLEESERALVNKAKLDKSSSVEARMKQERAEEAQALKIAQAQANIDTKYRGKLDNKFLPQLQNLTSNPMVDPMTKKNVQDLIAQIKDLEQQGLITKDIYDSLNETFKELNKQAGQEITAGKKGLEDDAKRRQRLQEIISEVEKLTQNPDLTIRFKDNELTSFLNSLREIQTQTFFTADNLKEVESDYKDINKQVKKSEAEQKELNDLAFKFQQIIDKTNVDGTSTFTKEYKDIVQDALNRIRTGNLSVQEGRKTQAGINNPNYVTASQKTLKNYMIRGQKLITQNYMPAGLKKQFEELVEAMRKVSEEGGHSRTEVNKLITSFQDLEVEAAKAGKTLFGQVSQRLRDMNAKFIATYFSFMDIIRYMRSMISTITELDTALTEMRKVSDESLESLKEYQKTTFDTAGALGTTAVQLQQSTADWLRLGESMEEAAKSAQAATTLFNVSEFENINEATTALVAMSQAYKDMDKTEIIDVMNNIGNNYSIATDQLATALQASASSLMVQGNDLYEAAALVTAGNAVIQDANKVGAGLRTISLRIAGVKEGDDDIKEELAELGEEVDDWVVSTQAKKRQVIMDYTKVAANDGQGVDILDSNGNLRDTYHILLDIAKIYKDIQEEDKKYGTNRAKGLVEELAGKNRSNIAASILMNPQLLEDVYNDALTSAGSAAEENAKYLDSIIGKTQQFKNELQELESNVLDSELIKDVTDFGTALLSVLNAAGDKLPQIIKLVGSLALAIVMARKELTLVSFDKENMTNGLTLFNKWNLNPKAIKEYKESISKFRDMFIAEADINEDSNLNEFVTNIFKNKLSQGIEIGKDFATNFVYGFKNNLSGVFQNDDVRNYFELLDEINQAGDDVDVDALQDLKDIFDGLDEETQNLITGLADQGIGTMEEFAAAESAAGVSAQVAAAGIQLLNTALTMMISYVATWAISKIVEELSNIAHASEIAADKADELYTELKQTKEEIQDNKEYIKEIADEYEALAEGVSDANDNLSLSSDEFDKYIDITNELASRFPSVIQYWKDENAVISEEVQTVRGLNEEFEKYYRNKLAERVSSGDAQAFLEDIYETQHANPLEQGLAFLTHNTKAGEFMGTEDLSELYDFILSTTYEEMMKTLSHLNTVDAQMLSYRIRAITNEDLDAYTSKEDYAAIQTMIQAHKDSIEYSKNQKLTQLNEAGQDYLEYKIMIDGIEIDDATKDAISKIIAQMDWETATSFENNLPRYYAYINNLIESLSGVSNNAISTLFAVDTKDKNFNETKQSVVDAYSSIYAEVSNKLQSEQDPEKRKALLDSLSDMYLIFAHYIDVSNRLDNNLHDIATTEQEYNELVQLTNGFTEEEIELWLKETKGIEGATNAQNAWNKARADLSSFKDIGALLSQDTIVEGSLYEKRYRELEEVYDRELALAKEKGADLNRTLFGNIDLNDRDVLEWNAENLEKYKDAIESWGVDLPSFGSISTVDAQSSEFHGIEIAFTPMLQTDHGAEYLDRDTVENYIDTLMSQLPDEWNDEDLLKLDVKGAEINGKYIQGLIAGIGDEARKVGEVMHFLGKDGALEYLKKQMKDVHDEAVTWGDIKQDLVGLAQAGKLDENTLKEYKYFDEILKALGISAEEADEKISGMVDTINKFATNNVVDDMANYRTEMDKLGDAYDKFKKGEFIDANTLSALQDAFGDLDSYQKFEEAVLSGETQLQSYFDNIVSEYAYTHNVLRNLNKDNAEYTKQCLIRAGVTKESAEQAVKSALEEKKALEGRVTTAIENANTDAVRKDRLNDLVVGTEDLSDATLEEIGNLITEAGITGEAANMIRYYAIQKDLAEHSDMRNQDDINYLIQVCELAGIAANSLYALKELSAREGSYNDTIKKADTIINKYKNRKNLNTSEQNELNYWKSQKEHAEDSLAELTNLGNKAWDEVVNGFHDKYSQYEYKPELDYGGVVDDATKGGEDAAQAFKEALDKILALYDAELDAGVIAFQEYVNKSRAIIEQYYREGKITAADYYDYLSSFYEKQVKEYDRVIQAVQELIQEQIEELEKQKESIEESYNLQIEEIQKKIDSLQEENEEIDKNIALQKAQ